MKRGRLALGTAFIVTAAALLLFAAPAQTATAAVSTNVCPSPTHGQTGSGFTWQLKTAGCGGNLVNCTTSAGVPQPMLTWDSPSTTTSGFSATVPNGASVGQHTLTGSCTVCGTSCFTSSGSGTFTVDPTPTTTTTTRPTTTTTTTTTQPKTTTTTQPGQTTTTATTQPGQTTTTATTRPGQTTTTSTTTTQPGDTVPLDTTTTAPPPTTPTGKPIVLRLDQPATPPEGDDQATGEGCEPNTPVTLRIGSDQVGSTSSDSDGHFTSHIDVPNLPVGEYDVVATCGRVLTTKIDLVLPIVLGPPTGTLAVVLFFLLMGFVLVRRQITGDLARSKGRQV